MFFALICAANVLFFLVIFFLSFQVITVALRCPNGAVQKRRFTVESQIKVLTLTSLFIYSFVAGHVRFMIFVSPLL